jgi:hypothetical protein
VWFAVAVLRAQTTGAIEGAIHDQRGGAVGGASLQLRETTTAAERQVLTDAAGRYRAVELAPGMYQVSVMRAGFRNEIREGLSLNAGEVLRVDFLLELGENRERIVVVSEAPLVSTSTAGWGGTLGRTQVDTLPLNGRDMFALAAQEPGVNLPATAKHDVSNGLGIKASVQGARPTQNSFQLDGVHLNDATGVAPAGAAGLLLGIESVLELRIVSSPFSAEYGRAAGAVFTAVSKSGSNQYHGSAYEFLRNSALDARNYFDLPNQKIPTLRRNQFGGLLGGPVRRDRVFFLANVEAIRERSGQTMRPVVPTASARAGILPQSGGGTKTIAVAPQVRPYLDLYPLPNGRDFGDGTGEFVNEVAQDTREDYATLKSDVLFSPAVRAAVRYTFDSSDRTAPDAVGLWRFATATRHHFVNTELQQVVSPHTIRGRAWVRSW